MNRRNFPATRRGGRSGRRGASSTRRRPHNKMIGIQVGAVSFVDEGVEKVLDEFQQDASINTLFVATFTYGRGIAGRQVPGQPLPDHGKQEYDNGSGPGTFHGGSYTKIHPQYYKDTVLQDFRAPDFGDYDVLEAVMPSARKRGMKTICWFEDVWSDSVPNVQQAQERNFDGTQRHHALLQQSQLPQLAAGHGGGLRPLVRDRRHHVGLGAAGRLFQCAARGHGGVPRNPVKVTCFCEFCERKAQQRGINVARAREGFQALADFVQAGRNGQASGGRLLRHALAPDAALSGTAGLGDALDRQPARDLRRHAHQGESREALRRRRLAHLAQQLLQPDLPRRAGPVGARPATPTS